jgi:hypothetical protein
MEHARVNGGDGNVLCCGTGDRHHRCRGSLLYAPHTQAITSATQAIFVNTIGCLQTLRKVQCKKKHPPTFISKPALSSSFPHGWMDVTFQSQPPRLSVGTIFLNSIARQTPPLLWTSIAAHTLIPSPLRPFSGLLFFFFLFLFHKNEIGFNPCQAEAYG